MNPRDRQRRRLTVALFVGNALSSTAYIAAVSVASIAARELTGSTHLAGLPSALSTIGSAVGASVLTSLSQRSGRRVAFCLGLVLSVVGSAVGIGSLWVMSFGALLGAMLVIGVGRSVSQLARYAAGDLWPDDKRASAIGFVVWAGTIGAVAGPLLIIPAAHLGTAYLGAELAGAFAVSGIGCVLAAVWYFATLRPEPMTLAATEPLAAVEPSTAAGGEDQGDARSLGELLRLPTVWSSFLVLMVAQFVMILVMTMTPVHIRDHHHGLTLVGGVMMSHTLGMFAIAPLTGYLVDRFGARLVILAGSILLALSSFLSSTAGEAQAIPLTVSLLVLGVGWNFAFVAASAGLQEGLPLSDRLRLQGLADAVTWTSGGVAALVSGAVMSAWLFEGLSIAAAVISLVPLVALRYTAGRR